VLAQAGAVTPKLVYFMTIDRAKFRKPVLPGDTVEYHVRKIRRRSNIWRFAAEARVAGARVAEAEVSAMLLDR
jgi:3-hydroxyacyl-[acyl-carrier-protein] dehydratase